MRPVLMRGLASVLAVLAAVGAGAAERVDVTAMDGVQLIAELYGTSGAGVVLVVAADADHWKTAADAIAARGFRVLRVDLRGQGSSAGAVDLGAADRDVEGAYRYVLGRKIRPVFLLGTEATASAMRAVAARVPTAGVRVASPSDDVESLMRQLSESQPP
jgi:alpha-beta hydrolase superfamily lysophospholipase